MNILNINNDYLCQVYDSYVDTCSSYASLRKVFASVDYIYYLLIDGTCVDRYISLNQLYTEGKITDEDYNVVISLFNNVKVPDFDIYAVCANDIALAYASNTMLMKSEWFMECQWSIADYIDCEIATDLIKVNWMQINNTVPNAICDYTKTILKEIELAIFKQLTYIDNNIRYISIQKNDSSTWMFIYIP